MEATMTAVGIGRRRTSRHEADLLVHSITSEQHRAFLATRPSVSFLQLPAWAAVKPEWESESLGWTAPDGRIVGAALVLYRRIPRLDRRLAYIPEGPVIDWASPDLAAWLRPMAEYLRSRGAFTVRMGPPVHRRWWGARTLRSAIERGDAPTLGDAPPDHTDAVGESVSAQLRQLGWRPPSEDGGGFAAGQPRHVFQVPLGGRTLEEVFGGFGQQWRRNIRTAQRLGVEVTEGGRDDLSTFHELYQVTAARDGFTPRPFAYFPRMWDALHDGVLPAGVPGGDGQTAAPPQHTATSTGPRSAPPAAAEGTPEHHPDHERDHDPGHDPAPGHGHGHEHDGIRLYLARHRDTVLAAALLVQVGDHAWYTYGASGDHDRRLKPSNAMQWQMLSDAHVRGATVYDLRGIGASLSPDDPLFGLTRFKLGSGGRAVEYLGEWELPLNRLLHAAVGAYLARR